MNPLFPIHLDGYYTDPHFDHTRPVKPLHFFSWEMLEVIAQRQVPTVVVGVVRLYPPNLRFLCQCIGLSDHVRLAAAGQPQHGASGGSACS